MSLPVKEEVCLYYTGYAAGHKPCRRSDGRQIGIAHMRLDGYASLRSGTEGGTMDTPLVQFVRNRMTLNVDSVWQGGEVRVKLQETMGNPVPGFSLKRCDPIRSNDVGHVARQRGFNLANGQKDQEQGTPAIGRPVRPLVSN